MPSISVTSGKFLILRTDSATGAVPYVEVLAEDDGGGAIAKDPTGRVWVFRCYNAKLQWRRSTDTTGTTFSAWADIIASAVSDGAPTAQVLVTGAVIVYCWKTDNKFYKSVSADNGATWTTAEVTT